MKKPTLLLFVLALTSLFTPSLKAQESQNASNKFFNHLAIGVNASTTGFGLDLAAPLSPYFTLRAGVDIMPDITFDTDVDVQASGHGYNIDDVTLTGSPKRTQASLLVNLYPSKRSSFFVSAGAYFGGKSLVGIEGQSDQLRELQAQSPGLGIIIGDCTLPVDAQGRVKGSLDVSGFRPYLGVGFGRAVPYKRVGFLFELGVQMHGTPKVKTEIGELGDLVSGSGDDDFSDIIDKLTVYPVIKFRLCGRLF